VLVLGPCLACNDGVGSAGAEPDAGGRARNAGRGSSDAREPNGPEASVGPDAVAATSNDAGTNEQPEPLDAALCAEPFTGSSADHDAAAGGSDGGSASPGADPGEPSATLDAGREIVPYAGPPDPGASPLVEGPNAFPVLPDPAPVEPVLSEPQPMSGHYILFVEHNTLVRLLDLETGEIQDLNSNDEPTIYGTTSPDGHSYMYSGTDHPQDAMWHVRLSDSEVTRVHQVAGYQGLDGNSAVWDWSFDSRYLRATRYGSRPGLEIIDAFSDVRVGGYVFESDISGTFVPNSYYFWMTEIGDGIRHRSIGKITDTGLAERKLLPDETTGMTFSGDGKRGLIRVEDTQTGEKSFHVFDLPGAMRRLETGDLDPTTILGVAMATSGTFAYALVADGDSQKFYRIFIDEGRSEPFGDPSLKADGIRRATDTNLVAVSYRSDDGTLYLALSDGDTLTDPVARPNRDDPGPAYLVGDHYGYGVANDEWHIASMADGQLVDTDIAEPGEGEFGCMTYTAVNPRDRIAVRHQQPVPGLIFVDMSEPEARRVVEFGVDDPDASLGCPLWSIDGSGCVISELLPGGITRFRVVRWGDDGPSEPETVYESTEGAVPYLMVP
jgi:hypothetical protein